MSSLAIVSAGIDPSRTEEFWRTWGPLCTLKDTTLFYVVNSPEPKLALPRYTDIRIVWITERKVLGPVAAFQRGILEASGEFSLIACLHDDVALYERGWDERIVQHFDRHPACTLAGYSGCDGLGAPDIYRRRCEECEGSGICQEDYNYAPCKPCGGTGVSRELHQLARQGFFSNMVGGEAHGRIELAPRLSACADGFSQIGRAAFLKRAFGHFQAKGIVHHAVDSWLGMLAWRWGGECWYLPEKVHHAGGRTAVLAPEWHAFAEKHGGDAGVWQQAHEALWEDGKGFLPFRVSP